MTFSALSRGQVADAIAGAFLAGDWEPSSMARRASRSLADKRKWVLDLARVARAAFPERPADRPRELAQLIGACEVFRRASHDRVRPLRVKVWISAPTEMGPRRWPVPEIADLGTLANWLGVTGRHLPWFADARSMERTATDERLRHYRRSWVSKPDGSARLLEAPKYELKELQRQILHGILDRIPPHEAAHGFCPTRSVRSGVAPHRNRSVVMRLDLESFFTSIDVGRVYGVFRLAGYPEPVAHSLAALCTTVTPLPIRRSAPPVSEASWEARRRLLLRLAHPHLAQGSPTSPALANLVAYRLDRRIAGLAAALGARYTRYADDLILSGDHNLVRSAKAIIAKVETIVRDEGFRVHERKTRVLTAAQRQTVTGLVVNRGANIPRPGYDRLRAILHEAARHGPERANRAGHPDFRAHLAGRIAWAGAGNEARAAKLAEAFAAIEWS